MIVSNNNVQMAQVGFAEEFECVKTFSTESQAVHTFSLFYFTQSHVNQPIHFIKNNRNINCKNKTKKLSKFPSKKCY